jgi:glycosyltransferase involved in cell wall biosynthesis
MQELITTPMTSLPSHQTLSAVPRVSIIVPSYNQGQFIGETLDSIFSQDYPNLELIVMDGQSSDNTVEVLKRYDGKPGYVWRSEPDRGVTDAVNKGLALASGEICGIQSSDDYYTPGAIRAAVDAMSANPDVLLVYADAEYIDADGRKTGGTQIADYSLNDLLARRTFIMQSSCFFRTQVAKDLKGWQQEVSYVADNDLWLRIALKGPCQKIAGVWSRYRIHEAQRDSQSERIVRDWNKSIEQLLPSMNASQRRAARVGCCLTAYRYAKAGDWWGRTKALYRAVGLNPTCVFWQDFPRIELLQPARQILSRTKRLFVPVPSSPKSP